MFELAGKLDLVATSSDDSVLAALRARPRLPCRAARPHPAAAAPPTARTTDSGLAFASGNWRRAVTDRRHPGMVVRRHFEAMVFTYLAEELRTGDIAITGAGEYADWRANLLPWEECEPLLEGFCAGAGLPATAAGFTERLRHAHLDAAARAGRRVRGQRRPGDRRGRRARPSSGAAARAPRRPPRSWRRRSPGGCPSGRCCRSWPAPPTGSAGTTTSARPRVGPEDRRPPRPVLHGRVHRRGQHRPVRGGPPHRRGIGPGAVDGPQPAHRPEEAQLRDRHRGQRLQRARRGQGVGRRHRGGRRRHPGRDLHRQPPGRDLDPVRRRRRNRVSLHFRHLRGAVLQVHPLRRVGGGAPDRGPAGQQVRHPAVHRPCRYAGPVGAGVRPGHLVRVRPDAPDPQLQGPDLLPAERAPRLPAH